MAYVPNEPAYIGIPELYGYVTGETPNIIERQRAAAQQAQLETQEYERGLKEQQDIRNALVGLERARFQRAPQQMPGPQVPSQVPSQVPPQVPQQGMPGPQGAPQRVPQNPQAQLQQMAQQNPQAIQELAPYIENYAQLMAVKKQASDFLSQFGPTLVAAQDTGNNRLKDAIVMRAMETGNPILMQTADLLRQADFPGKDEIAYRGSQLKGMDKQALAMLGLSPEQAQSYVDNDVVKFKGRIGQQMRPVDIKEKSLAGKAAPTQITTVMRNGKPHNVLVDKLTGEEIRDLGEAKAGTLGAGGRYIASEEDVKKWADAVQEGRVTIDKVPAFGGLRAKVIPEVERRAGRGTGAPVHYTADITGAAASKSSQTFVTKQLDASGSFIGTIDNNIVQLKEHIADMAKRHNMTSNRILNMGIRDFNKIMMGDADFNIYDMLINAISTENAKLVSGGAGSIAQVAEGARTEMDKIHDRNLPVKEMLKLLEATRREGGNRIKALEDQLKRTQGRTSATRKVRQQGKGKVLTKDLAAELYAETDRTKSKAERIKEAMAKAKELGYIVK